MSDQTTKLSGKALSEATGEALARLREQSPRIHCLTNAVSLEFAANTLLAIGAEPTMTSAADEVASFVEGCGALVINLGMLDPERRNSISIALDAAEAHGRPWILDPAYAQMSPIRFAFAKNLLQRKPKIIRANKIEIAALSGDRDAAALATSIGGSVAATGDVDLITDGSRSLRLGNGDPMMARVTAVGCVTSCLTAAFLAVEPDHLMAAAMAVTVSNLAGEKAAEIAKGPGSFRVSFLDCLAAIDQPTIETGVKLL